MDIKIHRYQIPWSSINFKKNSGIGALIALRESAPSDLSDSHWGYADLHPWPSLGDLDLSIQLERLKNGDPTFQTQNSILAAKRDLEFRKNQKKGLHYPSSLRNHHLILDLNVTADSLHALFESYKGLEFIPPLKWKISFQNINHSIEIINQMAKEIPQINWRLDFNSYFSKLDILDWWNHLSIEARLQIEFIEDPCPYHLPEWEELEKEGMRLAIDFEIKNWLLQSKSATLTSPTSSHNTILILKSAIQDMNFWKSWLKNKAHSFLITSYLDHPIGLLHAQWWAEEFQLIFPDKIKTCGLNLPCNSQELNLFWPGLKDNDLSGRYWSSIHNSEWGIGFNAILEKLDWAPL